MSEKIAWHRRLTVRVLLFLTLALVPLGAIGIVQNTQLFEVSERQSELSLLALTESAASGERQLIQRAIGSAQALGASIESVLDAPEQCSADLFRFLKSNDEIVYVGFLPVNGISTCSTAGRTLDFSNYPNFQAYVQNPRLSVEINLDAPGSGQSVMIVNQPRFKNGELQGFVSISLPLETVGQASDFLVNTTPILLATLNTDGVMLSSETERDIALSEMPVGINLEELAKGNARTFIAKNAAGGERRYGLIPIVPEVVYAISSFPIDGQNSARKSNPRMNTLLPLLMWAASLLVAWFAIDRLVLTRISDLYTSMQRFARDRTLPNFESTGTISAELRMLEMAFMGMAQDLVHDEAEQEAQIREKSILLKEVHHRVKNNLQIISSIMNMQIRKADARETKHALSQVQDRIMALSGVHRTLYQTENLTQLDARQLVSKIVDDCMAMGMSGEQKTQIETDLDAMTIYPDQAVPLSMLVAEALTNALKYCGPNYFGQSMISVSLKLQDGKHAAFCIENSRAPNADDDKAAGLSSGLGQQLIKAFAIQLNGQLQVESDEQNYRVSVDFEVEEFKEDVVDY